MNRLHYHNKDYTINIIGCRSIYLLSIVLLAVVHQLSAQTTINGAIFKLTGNQSCSAVSPTNPLEDITVDVYDASTNTLLSTQQTASDGTYATSVTASDIRIIPSVPNTNYFLGVSTYDLVLMTAFQVGHDTLNCPFQRLAADVDDSGSINSNDSLLIRDLILNNISSFPNVPSWRFVAKNYTRTDAYSRDIRFSSDFWNNAVVDENGNEYPFKAIYNYDASTSYDYNTSSDIWMDELNTYPVNEVCDDPIWDFYAIKMGDVSQSVDSLLSFTGNTSEVKNGKQIYTGLSKQALKSNTTYAIKVKAKNNIPILAFQLALGLDKDIEINNVTANSALNRYKQDDFSQIVGQSGIKEIRTLWVAPNLNSISMEEDFELFSMIVQTGETAVAVQIDETILPIEFIARVNGQLKIVPAELSLSIKEL